MIDKWYLDAVGADGRLLIAYHLQIMLGGIKTGAASVMWRDAAGAQDPATRTTARAGVPPEFEAGGVNWECQPLRLRMRYTPRADAIGRVLLESQSDRIDWRAEVPSGEVDIELSGERWCGHGYVERMQMTIPPWRLPIRRLHWGRWIGNTGWAVWIRWEGPEERSLVWDDAGLAVESHIERDRVAWTGVFGRTRVLRLDRSSVLRVGEIGGAVLQGLPMLSSLAPAGLGRILKTHETKCLSRGLLGEPYDTGWAIHEVVTFPEQEA